MATEAAKNKSPPTRTKESGKEASGHGLMSFTSTVPALVPSLRHSSTPLVDSAAEKNTKGPATVNEIGKDPAGPASMSFTRDVPALVPSLR